MLAVGALLSLGPPAYSAQDASLTIQPFAGVPPGAAADLAASSTAVSAQMRLNWTGPPVFPGSTLEVYEVRVKTVPPSFFGGSVLAWWNDASGFLVQGTYGESTGQAVVRTLGPPGSTHVLALTSGTTYYVALRSADNVGSAFNFYSAVSPVRSVFLPPPETGAVPRRPSAIWGEWSEASGLTLRWRAVTRDTDNLPVTIDHYRVERSTIPGGPLTLVAQIPAGLESYTENAGGLYYYRVRAVSTGNRTSAATDLVESTSGVNLHVFSEDDAQTRLNIPGLDARRLRVEYNPYGDDIEIVGLRRAERESEITLKAYEFVARRADSGQIIPDYDLPQPIPLQISYALNVSGVMLGVPSSGPTPADAQASAIAQIASVYWFNGAQWIRLGGTVIVDEQAFRVATRNLGIYEIRAVRAPEAFGLSRGSPYPRVITPNGSENRKVFFFFDNPTDNDVSGTIYDIRGAKVRELRVTSESPTSTSLVWDGRDEQGAVVPSGVYLYKIRSGDQSVTGTVAVAR